jgi:hypothetical protein
MTSGVCACGRVGQTVIERSFRKTHTGEITFCFMNINGDNGAGLGASCQTGWTGTIARVLDLFARASAADFLRTSKDQLAARVTRQQVAG